MIFHDLLLKDSEIGHVLFARNRFASDFQLKQPTNSHTHYL